MTGSIVTFSWESYRTNHQDTCFLAGIPPEYLMSMLLGSETLEQPIEPGGLIPHKDPHGVIEIDDTQFNRAPHGFVRITPRIAHHYPTRLLNRVSSDLMGDTQVFRCLSPTPTGWRIDLNPPLAGVKARLAAAPGVPDDLPDPGWNQERLQTRLFRTGPGLQARREDAEPDWPTATDLKREDESDDALFYTEPRFVTHIDDTTIAQVSSLYGKLIPAGARVLDIMSSWISHLPEKVGFEKVTGLGMNRQELEANPQLNEHRVHNLNRDPRLPFPDDSFDAVVCAVSVEYLAHPLEVFQDIHRVLAAGGVFINAFSNRCFPTKSIALWAKLHEFERMGLVAHFYHRTGYSNVNTWSMRGLPRPAGDPYGGQPPESDPVYAVWANN